MEEKRPKTIPGSTIAFAIATIILGGLAGYLVYRNTELEKDDDTSNAVITSDNYHIKKVDDDIYYVIDNDYDDEYDIQYVSLNIFDEENTIPEDDSDDIPKPNYIRRNSCSNYNKFATRKIMDYNEYVKFVNTWELKQRFHYKYENYAVFSYCNNGSKAKARLAEADDMGNNLSLYIWDEFSGRSSSCTGYVIIVPTYHSTDYGMNIIPLYEEDDVPEETEDPIMPIRPEPTYTVDKPMIYLYPKAEQSVNVRLGNPERLTVSYPSYVDSWNVVAKPDGSLKDASGRNLYGLYYESLPKTEFKMTDTGFIVKKEDSAKFLEEKLELLGLNEREAEEFIVYWLPKMNSNYNYVRFATANEIESNMKLSISPKPDTTIRVWMVLKNLDEPTEVTEQKINPVTRSGFTAVEWGGIKI